MQFEIKNLNRSINDIMRTIGYQPAYFQKDGEFSIVRQISRNDYPRFHLYIKEGNPSSLANSSGHSGSEEPSGSMRQMEGKSFIFSLHLDQKKPSYEGSTGHSGEYDGDVVEGEAERIKNILQ